MYSPIWMSANRIDEYSVWKPATISLSPSGRSKGLRAHSALAARKYTRNAGKCRTTFQFQNPPAWLSTMSLIRKDWAARISVTQEKPRASS